MQMASPQLANRYRKIPDAMSISWTVFGPGLAVAIAFVLSWVRLLRLTDRYAVNILFRDQWKFDEATLFQQHSLLEIFRWQHGPHRQGIGGVLSRVLEPLIQWNSRDEAFGILAVLLTTALLALWLKRRLIGKISYSDVIIPLIFLTPVQYQVIFEGANPSHGSIPVFLLITYCLAWTIPNQTIGSAAVLVVNFFLIYTGFGLFMGVITPLIFVREYKRNRNWVLAIATLISLLSFISFFVDYRFDPATPCFSPRPGNPFLYLLFIGFMLSSFIGVQPVVHLIPAILLGLVLLGIFFWVVAKMARSFWTKGNREQLIVFSLMGYSLLFFLATAYGRICLGLGAAQASRYTCYTSIVFFAAYLAATSARTRVHVLVILAMSLMTSFGLSSWDKAQIEKVSEGRRKWRECYFVYSDVAQCDQKANSTIYWTPEPPDLDTKLSILRARKLNLYSENSTN